jgi:hypothetical protein
MVFNNSPIKTHIHVLYQEMYWLHQWAQLQKHEELSKEIIDVYRYVESTVM